MRVGSIVKSNVDYQIGIVTEVRPTTLNGWKEFLVKFPDEKPMWLSKNVLDLICE